MPKYTDDRGLLTREGAARQRADYLAKSEADRLSKLEARDLYLEHLLSSNGGPFARKEK